MPETRDNSGSSRIARSKSLTMNVGRDPSTPSLQMRAHRTRVATTRQWQEAGRRRSRRDEQLGIKPGSGQCEHAGRTWADMQRCSTARVATHAWAGSDSNRSGRADEDGLLQPRPPTQSLETSSADQVLAVHRRPETLDWCFLLQCPLRDARCLEPSAQDRCIQHNSSCGTWQHFRQWTSET